MAVAEQQFEEDRRRFPQRAPTESPFPDTQLSAASRELGKYAGDLYNLMKGNNMVQEDQVPRNPRRSPGQLGEHYTAFNTYLAKKLFSGEKWTSGLAEHFVKLSREVYPEHYGADVPLIDKYDEKAAVYLVQAIDVIRDDNRYFQKEVEWFSLRFVPSCCGPELNEDLRFHAARVGSEKMPIGDAMIRQLDLDPVNVDTASIAMSRFGAIRPYNMTSTNGKEEFDLKRGVGNKHAGLAVALMTRQFLRDVVAHAIEDDDFPQPVDFFTCFIHPGLERVLRTKLAKGDTYALPFTAAYKALNLPRKEDVFIDREAPGVYAWTIFEYFLKDLEPAMKRAVLSGLLNNNTPGVLWNPVRQPDETEEAFKQRKEWERRQRSGLLTFNGRIPGTATTGEDLRLFLVNNGVQDATTFYIMTRDEWERGAVELIETAKDRGK